MPFSEGPNFEWKSIDESRIKLDSGEFKHIKTKKLLIRQKKYFLAIRALCSKKETIFGM